MFTSALPRSGSLIDSLSDFFHNVLVPQCVYFLAAPPSDSTKRALECQRLTRAILNRVVLRLDKVQFLGVDDCFRNNLAGRSLASEARLMAACLQRVSEVRHNSSPQSEKDFEWTSVDDSTSQGALSMADIDSTTATNPFSIIIGDAQLGSLESRSRRDEVRAKMRSRRMRRVARLR